MSKENRIVYFDYLRFFAIIAVMLLHISGSSWNSIDVKSFAWQTFNVFDSIARWGVPIFVMISGALFLNRDIPPRQIYKKYILRLLIAYVIWSIVYAIFQDGTIIERFVYIIKGHYHMWFIFMIIGLYALVPLIKPIIENEKRVKYFLTLSLVFAILIPFINTLANDFAGEAINKVVLVVKDTLDNTNMQFVLGYTGYFILGYYLNKIEISKNKRIIIYIFGIIGFIMTIGLNLVVSMKTNSPCNHYYSTFTINVLFEAIAVFTWFKYRKYEKDKLNNFFLKLANYSFGAYLVHALILEQLDKIFNLNPLSLNPLVSVIVILLIISLCSFSVSAILHRIPIIKKYIV